MAGAIKVQYVGSGATIPFGLVPKGVPFKLYLSIKNLGTSNLIISGIALTTLTGNAGDFVLNGFSGSLTIASGAVDETLSITFTPTADYETFETASLVFTSNSVSGTQNFVLTGTCAKLGTATNVNATSTSFLASASQSGVGTNTSTTATDSFPSTAVSVGATVLVSLSVNVTVTVPGGGTGGSGSIEVQYSKDGGTTWYTFYAFDSYGSATKTQAASISISGLTDTNQILIRAVSVATVIFGTGTVSINSTVSAIVASITTTGDYFVQITQTSALGNPVPPVVDFGTVVLGTPYTSMDLNITNPTPTPLSITVAPDAGSGYGATLTGANPVAAAGASTLVLNLTLTPEVGGNNDDLSAAVLSLVSYSASQNIEALYSAPAFTPAFTLIGDQEATALALEDAVNVPSLNYFDSTQACEEAMQLARQYFVDQLHLNKFLNRLWLLYERLGVFVMSCTGSVVNPKNMTSQTSQVTGDTATDGLIAIEPFDLQITGTCLNLTFDLAAGQGPVSLIGFVMKVDERGETIEGT